MNEAAPFEYTQDPGHGWVRVSLATLRTLQIDHLITGYSYQHGDVAYLEEDQDLNTFCRAYAARYGTPPVLREHYVDSTPIRRYAHYSATPAEHTRWTPPPTFEYSDPEHHQTISDADSGL